jgi:hypothetical protein
MRLLHAATLTVSVLLLAAVTSAQGLGDAAAKEKQKRKAAPVKPAKVYTDGDIGRSMAPVSSTTELPATADAAAAQGQGAGDKTATADAADPEKAAAEARAKAEADWRKQLDDARKEEAAHLDLINKLQLALADTSSLYNPGRAANATQLEQTQKQLADVKTRIAALEENGRRNGYR